MMGASIKNVLIGVFVISAIATIIFMLLFIHPSVGDNAKTLHVRFNDIDKVNVGTRVTFAGRPVGEVISIHELPGTRISRSSKDGDIYTYELILKVDSGVEVFNTDLISLRTSGLLGERNIAIDPRPLKLGETLQNVEQEILYAAQTSSVEDTMKQVGELSQKFTGVLDDIHDLMREISQRKVVAKIDQTLENVASMTLALNQPKQWGETLENLRTLSEKANDSWKWIDASLQRMYGLTERAQTSWSTVDRTLDKFYTTAKEAAAFAEKANQIIEGTRQGKGTLGQLFVGEDAFLRLKSILHKGEVVMDDINSYGLLFHLDKRWQRLQGGRLRLLEKLSKPHEFANYFNQEIDQISASLSRVAMVLNESAYCPQSLLDNRSFTQRFSELLRRVENMETTLKIYNEQVIHQDQVLDEGRSR